MSVVNFGDYNARHRANDRAMIDHRIREAVRSVIFAVIALRQLGYSEEGLAKMLNDIREDEHPEMSVRLI